MSTLSTRGTPPAASADRPTGRSGRLRGWLDALRRRLFPVAPPRPPTRRGVPVVTAVAAVAAATAVSLARQPGAGALDTVWAEDGTVFLADAVNGNGAEVASPYRGYFHLAPRLVAELVALLPAPAAAEALAISAALLTALMALLVYVASAGHLPGPLPRLVVSAGVVLIPQDEVLNSIANLHWPGLYTLFWVLLWTPSSRAGRIVAVGSTVLVVGSDVLVLALAPLLLLRLLARRDRYTVVVAAAFGAGLAVQAVTQVIGEGRRLVTDPTYWLDNYLFRVVPAALLGPRWPGGGVGRVRAEMGPNWREQAAVAGLLILAVLVVALARRTAPDWPLAATAAGCSVALYALPVFLSTSATFRYAYAPALLLVVALVALLRPRPPAGTGPTARSRLVAVAPLAVLTALLAAVWTVNFRPGNARGDGPAWDAGVAAARAQCPEVGRVRVRIPPLYGSWSVDLPCGYVRAR